MRKGTHHGPEAIARNRTSNTGRVLSPETRAKMSAALRGNTHTKGHVLTPEHRAAISAGSKGKPKSPETRARMSASLRLRRHTPEGRAKIGATKVGNSFVLTAPIKGECVYCFGPATTRDHVIPRGRPGWDDPGNIVLACLSCNTSKRDSTPEEWVARIWATQLREAS